MKIYRLLLLLSSWAHRLTALNVAILLTCLIAVALVGYAVYLCRKEEKGLKLAACLMLWIGAVSLCAFQTHTFPATDTANNFTGNNTFTQLQGCQVVNASQSFAAALTAVGSNGCIQVSPGTYTVSVNAAIPAGVTLSVTQNGLLSIATGVTLTINGSINAGPYAIFTYVGTGVVAMPNTQTPTVLCNWFTGSDIHVSCQNAVNAMDSGTSISGNLQIAPGTYNNVLGNVTIPLYNNGRFTLSKYGTVLNLGNVSGLYAFDTKETSGAPANSNLVIQGGVINCGGFAWKGGIHLLPTNGITVRDESILSCNSGAGIEIEGSILVNITNTQLLGNKWGLHAFATKCQTLTPFACGTAPSGATLTYTPNGIHAIGNIFGNSTVWGAFLDSSILGNAFQILNPVFIANDFEANNAAAGAGGLYIQSSVGAQISGNYFEANLAHDIQLGIAGGTAQGVSVTGNWFTVDNVNAPLYNIELVAAPSAYIEGNVEGGNHVSTCFVNQTVTANQLFMGINQTFTSSPLCVTGSAGTPTGLLGFNQNSGGNNNVLYGRGLTNLTDGWAISFDSGPSKLNFQGTTSGGEITDNPTTKALLAWDNSGNFKLTGSEHITAGFSVDQGIYGGGTGLQHKRVSTGSIGATTRTEIVMSWTTAFSDANYDESCSVEDGTTAAGTQGLTMERVRTKSSTQIGVVINNPTAGALTGTLTCTAMHDNASLP